MFSSCLEKKTSMVWRTFTNLGHVLKAMSHLTKIMFLPNTAALHSKNSPTFFKYMMSFNGKGLGSRHYHQTVTLPSRWEHLGTWHMGWITLTIFLIVEQELNCRLFESRYETCWVSNTIKPNRMFWNPNWSWLKSRKRSSRGGKKKKKNSLTFFHLYV